MNTQCYSDVVTRRGVAQRLALVACASFLAACSVGNAGPSTEFPAELTRDVDWSAPFTAALSAELTAIQIPSASQPSEMAIHPAARSSGLSLTEQRMLSSLAALDHETSGVGFPDYRVFDGPVAFAGYDVTDDNRSAKPTTLLVLGQVSVPQALPITVDASLGLPPILRTTDPNLLNTLLGNQFDLDFTINGQVVPVFAYRTATGGISTDNDPTSPTWSPTSTAVHELFHAYQRDGQWWSDKRTDEVYLPDDIIDTEGVVLATMEEQALRSALEGTDVFDPNRTGRAKALDRDRVLQELQRFLALRTARVAGNPELADYLNVTETEEGTAEWVQRNAALWSGDNTSFDQLNDQFGRVGDRAYYGDGSTYNVGLSVLTALDALGTDWRTDIANTGVQEIATTAYGHNPPSTAEAEMPFDIGAITALVKEQDLAEQPRGRR